MKLILTKDYDAMSRAAADLVIEQVKQKPGSLICFPSGDSPAGMFRYLIADAGAGNVDFSHCNFVGLDEWVGMDDSDEGSCTRFLNDHFFGLLSVKPPQVKFFDAKATDLDASCRDMDGFVARHGPLDMMIVGIGMNGHIGLNEPGTDFNLYAHHAPLDPVTVTVGQKYFNKETPLTGGITLGLKHLQEAKMPLLIAAGSKKASIIKQALQGEVTQQLPASIFQTLSASVVLLDEGAASELGE
ncbi:MAG TPA: glucosamine-6-phosphate deaminase [Mucilaginibacter sp.]|nr:glucosamine-6-phosphate deaminase [Mucilaginibacter sp.]